MRNYPTGTKVQHRTGYVHVKGSGGKWKSEHRWIAELKILSRELEPGEKVFHKDGDRAHNDDDNLVVIKFNTAKFVPLKKARIIFMPKTINGIRKLVEA